MGRGYGFGGYGFGGYGFGGYGFGGYGFEGSEALRVPVLTISRRVVIYGKKSLKRIPVWTFERRPLVLICPALCQMEYSGNYTLESNWRDGGEPRDDLIACGLVGSFAAIARTVLTVQ